MTLDNFTKGVRIWKKVRLKGWVLAISRGHRELHKGEQVRVVSDEGGNLNAKQRELIRRKEVTNVPRKCEGASLRRAAL